MPLIAAKGAKGAQATPAGDPHATHRAEAMLSLSDHARAMARVETVPLARRPLEHEIRAVGKVQYNESALAVISSRVEGYIERLYVDFTGVKVRRGDHLAEIYSPDLVLAQKELVVALDGPADSPLVESSKLKLLRWGLTAQQVDDLVRERKVSERVTLFSPIDGTVTERMAVSQAMVRPGETLYQLANLDSVWVYLDIYESEIAWIQTGRSVKIVAEGYPDEAFEGRIWFVNPSLTEESRTVKVLVNIANTEEKLKPGMFVSATILVPVTAAGRPAPSGLEGQFTCTMHPQVTQPASGKCPRCGMELIVIPGGRADPGKVDLAVLALPATAVLDSGTRQLVYVEREAGEFVPVEPLLGPRAGEFYPVLGGLEEGARVAVRGGFLIDSQLQIQGQPSLLTGDDGVPAPGHGHAAPPAAPGQAAPKAKAPGHSH